LKLAIVSTLSVYSENREQHIFDCGNLSYYPPTALLILSTQWIYYIAHSSNKKTYSIDYAILLHVDLQTKSRSMNTGSTLSNMIGYRVPEHDRIPD